MVYRLTDEALKFSEGYDHIDPERSMDTIKFLHPGEIHWSEARSFTPMIAGYHVDPETVPRMLQWSDTKIDRIPDVDKHNNTLLISTRVRDAIERVEPSVHQFLPVNIYCTCPKKKN